MTNKAAFLDRDGTLIYDTGYLHRVEDISWLPHVFDVLKHLIKKKYKLIVITNQSGIGRGLYSQKEYEQITQALVQEAQIHGITFANFYHCPHVPEDHCHCRKPSDKLFLKAIEQHNIDPSRSLAIGDRERDLQPAKQCGVPHTYLVNKNEGFSSIKELICE